MQHFNPMFLEKSSKSFSTTQVSAEPETTWLSNFLVKTSLFIPLDNLVTKTSALSMLTWWHNDLIALSQPKYFFVTLC